ncbi:hypothetical protein [Nannocystis sp.]|uniref:hypothetical protein n=1 Tax=Nannocystis sp. TaxID=1962667 RepID=UPI0024266BE8|nr:hypothetical protein [Nannocystis sp.]MBK7827039.1 hypothetical protein [Nannocystis sp.]MBK9755933.1 hypothetical protein [Nannocystis sp.]
MNDRTRTRPTPHIEFKAGSQILASEWNEMQVQIREELARARAELTTAIDALRGELTATRGQLDATKATLGDTQQKLGVAEKNITALRSDLQDTQQKLRATQSGLDDARLDHKKLDTFTHAKLPDDGVWIGGWRLKTADNGNSVWFVAPGDKRVARFSLERDRFRVLQHAGNEQGGYFWYNEEDDYQFRYKK